MTRERCESCGWEIDGIRRRMVRVEDVIVCQDCYMAEDGVDDLITEPDATVETRPAFGI